MLTVDEIEAPAAERREAKMDDDDDDDDGDEDGDEDEEEEEEDSHDDNDHDNTHTHRQQGSLICWTERTGNYLDIPDPCQESPAVIACGWERPSLFCAPEAGEGPRSMGASGYYDAALARQHKTKPGPCAASLS